MTVRPGSNTSALKCCWNSSGTRPGCILSTQVLQELCVNLRRKVSAPLPVEEVRLLIRDYATWKVVSNTPESILQALDMEKRYRTSFWDALILQAAESAGASILYSEDWAAVQHSGSIQIVNPLIGMKPHS